MVLMRSWVIILILIFAGIISPCDLCARSPSNARHTGIEPPGEPRMSSGLPGNSPSRTAEGGMGYIDAYGNTLSPEEAQIKKPRRLKPGAYGARAKTDNHLPDPVINSKIPWKF